MAKAYQLTDTDDLQTVEKWIVVGEVPFEVVFESEVVAVRAAELLSCVQTFGDGLAAMRLPTFAVFMRVEKKKVECLRCKGLGHVMTASGQASHQCVECKTTGLIEVSLAVLDTSRPGGYEDRRLSQVRAVLKTEITEEVGFDRNKDCPDKTTERRVGYNGDCERCPYLLREEIENEDLDVIGHRWMCKKRQKEVKVAERFMGKAGPDGKA